MSANLIQARKNRILALRTVAARNIDPLIADDPSVAAHHHPRRAQFSIVEGVASSPWATEESLAA